MLFRSTLSDNTIAFLERGDLGEVRDNLRYIVDMVRRMATLTSQLKTFARKSTGEAKPVPLAGAVDAALLILRRRLEAEKVATRIDTAADAVVACDENRLEQVVINLVANALDAMAGVAAPRLEITARRAGARVIVDVHDAGPGLTQEAAQRLFEPFFTTKEARGGLGLGLTISAGIVHDFGGTISGASHPDGGAVFTVDLPAATEDAG